VIVVCPCEDVTADDVREAIALGASQPDDVKRVTRCGMGFCQGVFCEPAVRHILGDLAGAGPARFRKRVPVRPVPLEILAAAAPSAARQSSALEA
jgi:bacterioferritin-associated ferredoxin